MPADAGKENQNLDIRLFRFFDVNDLTTLVDSGFRIDPVGLLRFTSFLVDIVLRNRQSVMGSALACARFRMSSFWIWHI